jgi:transposase
VTDNATSHKSRLIREYLESTGGDVVLMYLPPYTPQLNPIEIQWRMIKARLAGRYFATEDEMERSIIRLVESGEVQPVRISNLPIA